MKRAASIALAPLSLAYRAAVKTRSAFYRTGIFHTQTVSVPVISVGNITTGGTGKTPLVAWIAEKLAQRGHRVCVLTRGYRRANSAERVLVSDGETIVSDVDQAGDEAMMLARSLLGKAAVVCDVDRVSGAHWAIENLKTEVLILDDGFQHVRIGRDLDIVTVDATNPWGNGRLLPAGILREPINGLSRADCIILTRGGDAVGADLQEQIRKATDAPTFGSTTVIRQIAALDSPEGVKDKQALLNQPMLPFCGIGNPNAFFQQLRDEGFDLLHTEAFRDHHKYSQKDIDRLSREAANAGAQALITTEKDAVKLGSMAFTLPCYVVEIETQIERADEFLAVIDAAIQAKRVQFRSNFNLGG